MAIIKIGKVFKHKFGDREEPRVDVALGGLPTTYSIVRPFRNITDEDKFKINLQLTAEQYEEVKATMLEAMQLLNAEGSYGATKKQLEEALSRSVGPSTKDEGKFRFYGSRSMGFADKETGEMHPFSLPCYNGSVDEANLIEGGVTLGSGSVIRTVFTLSLFAKGKQVFLNINPAKVVVLKRVEPPKREGVSHDGLEDSDAYDF